VKRRQLDRERPAGWGGSPPIALFPVRDVPRNQIPVEDVAAHGATRHAYDAAVSKARDQATSSAQLMRQAMAHADGLYNFAHHLARNGATAEDLVQETYARALGAAAQFKEGSDVKAWLFRILRNTFIDLHRRTQSRRTDGGLDTVLDDRSAVEEGGEPGQVRQVVGREIERALSTLTEDARMAVLLDLEGFSEAEMAECLGCAVGTVKSRLFRARAALRERLRDHAEQ
jgi:RNA polymerase sigma-70 factor (ECF subfamily)